MLIWEDIIRIISEYKLYLGLLEHIHTIIITFLLVSIFGIVRFDWTIISPAFF